MPFPIGLKSNLLNLQLTLMLWSRCIPMYMSHHKTSKVTWGKPIETFISQQKKFKMDVRLNR